MSTDTNQPASASPASKAPSLGAVLSKTVAPSAWVEYKEGIKFQLRYMSKARFRALADECTEHRYNPQRQVREP